MVLKPLAPRIDGRWEMDRRLWGVEEVILGDGKDIPPTLPVGARRVVAPQTLGCVSLAVPNAKCDGASAIGPIPPVEADFGAFNRWKQLHCDPQTPHQPDLALDIKLRGKRTTREQTLLCC
jgi:hypothetical protein